MAERGGHWPAGHRLFAQYAHAPNALGYCGPTGSATLVAAATGSPPVAAVSMHDVAQRFSGAWPYQQLIAELGDIEDPLSAEVVRAYWTGNELTAALDHERFGAQLLARFADQAGHYWSHLTAALLPEVAPTHAFHVLGVYPWSRLLGKGPEPLQVLESCRIGWGEVLDVGAQELTIRGPQLEFHARTPTAPARLELGANVVRTVEYLLDGAGFVADWQVGDHAAIHWGFACDRLSDTETAQLTAQTQAQLTAMAGRIAALD